MTSLHLQAGTSILGIIRGNRIIIAADSLTRIFETQSELVGSKFLVFENQPVAWAIASSATVFWACAGSLPKYVNDSRSSVILEALSQSQSFSTFREIFIQKIGQHINVVFNQMQSQAPDSLQTLLDKPYPFAEILIGISAGGKAKVYIINFSITEGDETHNKKLNLTFTSEEKRALYESHYEYLEAGYLSEAEKFIESKNYKGMGSFEIIAEAMKIQLEATPEVSGYPIEFLDILPDGGVTRYAIESKDAPIEPEPPKLDFIVT